MAKKKKGSASQAKLSPANYIRKVARKLPIVKCIMNDSWEDQGVAVIYLMRQKKNGELVGANYLVDVFCLGVKEVGFMVDVPEYAFKDMIEDYEENTGLTFEDVDPIFAQNLIYGAVEYAEDLGFKPAKDFDKTCVYLLDDVEALEYQEVAFGKEGKPFYIAGPRDDVYKTLDTLTAIVGEGNFEFYIPEQHPLSDRFNEGEEGDFEDEDSDVLDFEEVGPKRIFDFEDESEIYTFSDKEYEKETQKLGADQTGFQLDSKLGELYLQYSKEGANDLNPNVQSIIVSDFTAWAKENYIEDAALLEDLFNPENMATTNQRIDYTLDSFEAFKQSEQFKDKKLRDYILSAYIR